MALVRVSPNQFAYMALARGSLALTSLRDGRRRGVTTYNELEGPTYNDCEAPLVLIRVGLDQVGD